MTQATTTKEASIYLVGDPYTGETLTWLADANLNPDSGSGAAIGVFDGLVGLVAIGELAVASSALSAAIAASAMVITAEGVAEAGTAAAYFAALEEAGLASAAGGPVGAVIGGAIVVLAALGFGIDRIVQRVRADNTTTVVLVNGVADSTLSITSMDRIHGIWVGQQTDAGILDIVAKGGAAGSFTTQALVFSFEGRSEGSLTGRVSINGVDSTFSVGFKNDLGPRHQGPVIKKSDYPVLSVSGPITVVSQLNQPNVNSRNDIVVVNISPAS